MVLVYFRRNEKPLRSQRKKKKRNATCSLDEKKTVFRHRARPALSSKRRGRGGFDLQKPLTSGVSLSFSRGQHLFSPLPRRIFCVSNAKLQPSFEEITPRSVDRVSLAIRPLVFLPVPLISSLLWEAFATGSSWDDSRFAFRSITTTEANEAVFQVLRGIRGGGKVSKPRLR